MGRRRKIRLIHVNAAMAGLPYPYELLAGDSVIPRKENLMVGENEQSHFPK